MRVIAAAEKNFFAAHHTYSAAIDDLNLGGVFQCSDVSNCAHRQNNGYFFEIVVSAAGGVWSATGTPAVVGKTGSTRVVTDSTGGIFEAPLPEAESVHQQMFDHINAAVVQTLLRLILQRPQDFPEITRGLESQRTTERAFNQLDVNGDGRVSFTDLNNYSGVGADVINPFIAIIDQEMQLAAGGEDVGALPGVTLEMLEVNPGPINAQVSGLSQFINPGRTRIQPRTQARSRYRRCSSPDSPMAACAPAREMIKRIRAETIRGEAERSLAT